MDKLEKSPDAYRTISEVSDQLDVPQHVLRFWETKFPQVAPMKRAGNRRYYDPDHIALLSRIRDLLYVEGYTTKGVQKLLEEGRLMDGVEPVSAAPAGPSANLMDLTAASQPDEADDPGGSVSDSVTQVNVDAPADEVGIEVLSGITKRLKSARDRLEAVLLVK